MSGEKNYEIRITNQGITYELKKLAQSEFPNSIMSDDISASEWKATLEELRKINDERKIFGGCDDVDTKDWRRCFIVKMGDVIQFTRDEMNRLFNAMGITVNNNSNAQEVENPVQIEQQEGVQTEEVAEESAEQVEQTGEKAE